MTSELVEADAAAVRATVEMVTRVSPEDLARPTPCAGWDLRALLAHMTIQHEGFAAAAVGRGADEAIWRPRWQDPQPLDAYASSAALVLEAFAAGDILERRFHLPEVSPDPVPAKLAISFHLVDYVVHGWDVAAALGLPWDPPADALALALPVARKVPDGDNRKRPGASFAPGLPTSEDDPATEILALLGRSRAWRPENVGGA